MIGQLKKSLEKLVFAGIVTLVLAGCQKEARATLAETYFPLRVGNSWTYTNYVDPGDPGGSPRIELTFTIIGTEEIDGHTYYKFNDYFNIYPPPPNGEWPVTEGREVLFRYDSIADVVIKCPIGGTPQMIRYDFSDNEWDPGFAIGWCLLKQSGVRCNVPAGEFSDCVNFGFGRSYSNPDYYTYGEYLAPGVGTIKYVRPGSGSSEGERVTFVLQSYTIIPEPSTILLLTLGGLLLRRRN